MQSKFSQLDFIGYAVGVAGEDERTKDGPAAFFSLLKQRHAFCSAPKFIGASTLFDDKISYVAQNLSALREAVKASLFAERFFTVIGGDHSCGMGTWSAAAQQFKDSFALIWVDAHIDAHTFETSPSQNIHGMPVAHLLGVHCDPMTSLYTHTHPIHPSNLYMIGMRSYEPEELALLLRLGVRVYFIEEVQQRGIGSILAEILSLIQAKGQVMGMSIDIDAFDPKQMPGTGLHVPGGISIEAFLKTLRALCFDSLLGVEIAEYNPHKDVGFRTLEKMIEILEALGVFDLACMAPGMAC